MKFNKQRTAQRITNVSDPLWCFPAAIQVPPAAPCSVHTPSVCNSNSIWVTDRPRDVLLQKKIIILGVCVADGSVNS